MANRPTIILGAGPGGLLAASMLARAGKRVVVLEQHHTVGGGLQSFSRRGEWFDTGFHYVGAMDEGQVLRQIFRYAGLNELPLRRLSEEAFDRICLGDNHFDLAMGCDRFVERLAEAFPHQREKLHRYLSMVRQVGESVSVEEFRAGRIARDASSWQGVSAEEVLRTTIDDPTLRAVLTGNAMLYGGGRDHTSFYDHAMILHSFVAGGAYAFSGGTQQVADALRKAVERQGGEVVTRARVVALHLKAGRVEAVETEDGRRWEAEEVISTLHPRQTFALLRGEHRYRPSFFERLNRMADSCALFTLYLHLPEGVSYRPTNYYLHRTEQPWPTPLRTMEEPLEELLLTMQPPREGERATVLSLMTPMAHTAFEKWNDTTHPMQRGEAYEAGKAALAERMVRFADRFRLDLPLTQGVRYTASPLTWRDYTSTPNGSAYGLVKDFHNPLATHLPARTRIENLWLAGQSVNLHGGLGVALSSVVAAGCVVGEEQLTKAIANA